MSRFQQLRHWEKDRCTHRGVGGQQCTAKIYARGLCLEHWKTETDFYREPPVTKRAKEASEERAAIREHNQMIAGWKPSRRRDLTMTGRSWFWGPK